MDENNKLKDAGENKNDTGVGKNNKNGNKCIKIILVSTFGFITLVIIGLAYIITFINKSEKKLTWESVVVIGLILISLVLLYTVLVVGLTRINRKKGKNVDTSDLEYMKKLHETCKEKASIK